MADLHMENIVRTDMIACAFNRERLGNRKRIVDLACGHKAITTSIDRCVCLRCREMHRRSVETGEEDWDTYRHGDGQDNMIWRDDPCRQFNERTDLEGNFIND